MSTDPMVSPLARREFDAAELMRTHPPLLRNPNKQLVYDIACPSDAVHHGTVSFTRWAAQDLPAAVASIPSDLVLSIAGYFDYRPVLVGDRVVEWHVNFADPHLFVAYAGPLFAQDEMQVAEHPVLAALKQALEADGVETKTVGRDGPTPVLVTGAERRVSVDTDPDPNAGRPHGLYGNAFARADPDVIRAATTRIDRPTVTNLIAMAAIGGGWGEYSREEIRRTLVTAYTGFRAAVAESRATHGAETRVPVHTGYWGCGAFGGNRVLMAMLQVLAARMAGVEVLAFHTGAGGGGDALADALDRLSELLGAVSATSELLARIESQGFRWGVSDGN